MNNVEEARVQVSINNIWVRHNTRVQQLATFFFFIAINLVTALKDKGIPLIDPSYHSMEDNTLLQAETNMGMYLIGSIGQISKATLMMVK